LGNERTVLASEAIRYRHSSTSRGLLGRTVWIRVGRRRRTTLYGERESQPLGDGPRKTPQRTRRYRQRERSGKRRISRFEGIRSRKIHRPRGGRRRPADRGERGDRRGGCQRDLGENVESDLQGRDHELDGGAGL